MILEDGIMQSLMGFLSLYLYGIWEYDCFNIFEHLKMYLHFLDIKANIP